MRRRWICLILTAIVAVLWVWRYSVINQYYREAMPARTEEYFISGEDVPFGDDYIELHEPGKGYTIRCDNLEIVEFNNYVKEKGISLDNRDPKSFPEKLALISITLTNIDSSLDSISLTEFKLFGVDSNPIMDYEMLPKCNEILSSGATAIALKQGMSYSLILPFRLDRDQYNYHTWNNLMDYRFSLKITSFPTEKYIQLD